MIMTNYKTSLSQDILSRIAAEMQAMYDQGYQEGCNDTLARIVNAAQNGKAADTARNEVASSGKKQSRPIPGKALEAGSVIEGLYKYVKANPGLKASKVIEDYKKSASNDFHAVYARTALHRLKTKGYLENRSGKWY